MMATESHNAKDLDGNVLGDHYEGFEDARHLNEKMVEHFRTFKDLAAYVGDDIVNQAFKIRPCVRLLRYIGREDCQDSSEYFVKGCLYQSIDFNGATYSILGYRDGKRRIGSAYFEWVKG